MDYSTLTMFALLSGFVIPILVGLLTKLDASPGLKAVLNFGLTAAASILAVTNEIDFDWRPFLVNWSVTWLVSVATYYGLFVPTGLSRKINEATADFGVG